MQQPNTLTIIKLQNLEISENLLLWGMRFCLNSSKLDKLPLKKLLTVYSKFKLDDISYSLDQIMKLIINYNSTQSMGFKCNCTFLTEEEFNLLCAISNIANSLERESYFLPLRHNENINFNNTQNNFKRILH